MEEIEKGQKDPDYKLKMSVQSQDTIRRTRGPRYTPVSKRQDKPDGIAWILKNHPEVSDGAIGKLIGTTRNTINAIRDRSHWNIANIAPKDPVTLGLCAQRELDAMVAKAAKKAGIEPAQPEDEKLGTEKEALIEELRRERDKAAADAQSALEAEAAAFTGGGSDSDDAPPRPEDLFKK